MHSGPQGVNLRGYGICRDDKVLRTASMRDKIHPKYVDCTVTCGCGHSFKTRSTKPELKVEICSNCHPFFTGQEKFLDSAGRVERFTKKFGGNYFVKAKQEKPKAKA